MISAKMNEGGEPVQLYLYDLSRGMAKTLSPQLVGKTIGNYFLIAAVATVGWCYCRGNLVN